MQVNLDLKSNLFLKIIESNLDLKLIHYSIKLKHEGKFGSDRVALGHSIFLRKVRKYEGK